MRKRKTLLIVMLSFLLAALVAAAAVLGVALARSAYTDTSETYASEARWSVKSGTVEASVDAVNIRPDYTAYTGAQRTKEFMVCIATLENDGDVDASVTVTADGGGMTPVTDGADGYTDGEIRSHFSMGSVYYSDGPYLTSSTGATHFPADGALIKSGDEVYIYLEITWTTDLDRDIEDTVTGYDGRQGDEFDIWASRHLLSLTVPVTVKSEQTETV